MVDTFIKYLPKVMKLVGTEARIHHTVLYCWPCSKDAEIINVKKQGFATVKSYYAWCHYIPRLLGMPPPNRRALIGLVCCSFGL